MKNVGCGPLAVVAAERGAAERRRWDAAAATMRVAAAASCGIRAPSGGGSGALRDEAKKVGCGSGNGASGNSGIGRNRKPKVESAAAQSWDGYGGVLADREGAVTVFWLAGSQAFNSSAGANAIHSSLCVDPDLLCHTTIHDLLSTLHIAVVNGRVEAGFV
uniref:Uncharacterized protein n=1 Tax=Ananas comosus var. bracteatus TaxID=296719 RepID=A0A6V7PHR6_ANACO|nr:unnamed protein product [Ananas comosus var. bracteatus]